MNCTTVESLFSELHERTLPSGRARRVRDHLARCARCAAGFAAFEEALEALRAVGPTETGPWVRDAILAAVDVAASEDADERDVVFQRAMLLARGSAAGRERRQRLMTHALALLIGAAAVLLVLLGLRYAGFRASRTKAAAAPLRAPVAAAPVQLRWSGSAALLERGLMSVPVQALEELTLQPGDTLVGDGLTIALDERGALVVCADTREPIVETRVVELPVEVRVVETVDRVVEVERGPLFEWEARFLSTFAANLVSALERGALERQANDRVPPPEAVPEPDLAPAFLASVEQNAPSAPRPRMPALLASDHAAPLGRVPESTLSVLVEGDNVRLVLSGALEDQVDTLWTRLNDPDRNVAAAARRRLESIRRRAEQDPELGPRLAAADPKEASWLGQLFRQDSPDEPSWSDDWGRWWKRNRELVASVEGATL